jgi:glutamate--cysteine ligase
VTAGIVSAATCRRPPREAVRHLHQFIARRAFALSAPPVPQRVGAEIEFIAVNALDRAVAPLDGSDRASVLAAVRSLGRRLAWVEGRSSKGAPWFRLPSGGLVTFEPGGQIEYASPAQRSVSDLLDDLTSTATSLQAECGEHGIELLTYGLDPVNDAERAPLQIDGRRYRRMDAHFARIGSAGARMMRQTASLQIAVDIGADGGSRWRLLNALAPVLIATFANSKRYADKETGFASYRAETWRRTDTSRTGVFMGKDPISEYADFALRAPAILLGGDKEPALPFEHWLGAGASVTQWTEHLGTLFPEVRPRGYFEVRSIDAVPPSHWPAALALVAGVSYDLCAGREAAEVLGPADLNLLARAGRYALTDRKLRSMSREVAAAAIRGCERLGPSFIAERHLRAANDVLASLTG